MPKEDYTKYFNVLEVDSSASAEEIHRAYAHLKKLYSETSVITRPIEDDYPKAKKKFILNEIEEAYRELTILIAEKKKAAEQMPITEADTLPEVIFGFSIVGALGLKEIRENMNFSLEALSHLTEIPVGILENIELEKFEALPQPGLLRWYVLTVAKILNLKPKETADEYMKRYRQWQTES
jgi:hypothetical protein